METFDSLENQIIKGAELKSLGLKFVKVTNSVEIHHGLQLRPGVNTDSNEFIPEAGKVGGLSFTIAEYIGNWMDLGDGYRTVTFSDDEDLFIEENGSIKSKTIILADEKCEFIKIDEAMLKYVLDLNKKSLWLKNFFADNRPMCLFAAKYNGLSIEYMDETTKNDEEICSAAAINKPEAIRFVNNKFMNDVEFCKKLIESNAMCYKFLNKTMKKNKILCEYTLQKCGTMILIMDDEVKNDKKLCLVAIGNDADAIEMINNKLLSDLEFCISIFCLPSVAAYYLRHIDPKILADPKFWTSFDSYKKIMKLYDVDYWKLQNALRPNKDPYYPAGLECYKNIEGKSDLFKMSYKMKNNHSICKGEHLIINFWTIAGSNDMKNDYLICKHAYNADLYDKLQRDKNHDISDGFYNKCKI